MTTKKPTHPPGWPDKDEIERLKPQAPPPPPPKKRTGDMSKFYECLFLSQKENL